MFFLTMGYWFFFSFSHSLIVFFWTMGQWDYGTSRPTLKSCAKRTIPFTFHLSVYLSLSAMKAHMSISDFW